METVNDAGANKQSKVKSEIVETNSKINEYSLSIINQGEIIIASLLYERISDYSVGDDYQFYVVKHDGKYYYSQTNRYMELKFNELDISSINNSSFQEIFLTMSIDDIDNIKQYLIKYLAGELKFSGTGRLFLGDLADMDEEQIKAHLIEYYSGSDSYEYQGEPISKEYIKTCLDNMDVLIAYESVGDYGCDSSSTFVFRQDNKYYLVNGAHDSDRGFEGQFELFEVSLIHLQSDEFNIYAGYYDPISEVNKLAVKQFLLELCPACGKHIPNKEERLVHLNWEMETNCYEPTLN